MLQRRVTTHSFVRKRKGINGEETEESWPDDVDDSEGKRLPWCSTTTSLCGSPDGTHRDKHVQSAVAPPHRCPSASAYIHRQRTQTLALSRRPDCTTSLGTYLSTLCFRSKPRLLYSGLYDPICLESTIATSTRASPCHDQLGLRSVSEYATNAHLRPQWGCNNAHLPTRNKTISPTPEFTRSVIRPQ